MPAGYRKYVTHSGAVATTASTLKTIVGVGAITTQPIMLCGYRVSMDVTTPGNVALVEVMRFSTFGTMSSGTVYKIHTGDDAANGLPKNTATAEPTRGDILEAFFLTPNAPTFFYEYPYPDWPYLVAGAATMIGISVTPGASSTPNVRASLIWAE